MNIVSPWTLRIINGEQPSCSDLQEHLAAIHDNNAGLQKPVRGTVAILKAKTAMTYWPTSLIQSGIRGYSISRVAVAYYWSFVISVLAVN
jgi:hypothetical protein